MSERGIGDFHSLASTLPPYRVSDFLALQSWVLVEKREGLYERWAPPGFDPDSYPQTLYLLPLNNGYADYERRLVEILVELSRIYECDADGLLQRIQHGRSDSLLVRLIHHDSNSESVGLAEAKDTLSVVHRLFDLSARYTYDSNSSFRGRPNRVVASYLKERVALGHTLRGSFIFPFYSLLHARGGSSQGFARGVFENLAKGLQWIKGDVSDLVEREAEALELSRLGLALAAALKPIAKFPDLASFDISIRRYQVFVGQADSPVALGLVFSFTPDEITGPHSLRRSSPISGNVESRRLTQAMQMASESRSIDFTGLVVAVTLDERVAGKNGGSGYSAVVRRVGGDEDSQEDFYVEISEDDYWRAIEANRQRDEVRVVGFVDRRRGVRRVRGEIDFSLTSPRGDDLPLGLPIRLRSTRSREGE